jgi:hexosaminidase
MIGWNDILGDDIQGLLRSVGASSLVEQPAGEGLAPGTIVHFWLGDSAIIERATRQGHDIVNSQASKTYFDDTYEALPLAEAYSFDPVPDSLEQFLRPRILGLGCQMWSEWASSAARVECRTFPRLAALAEVGWTSPGRKDYTSFCSRLDNMQVRWDLQGIRYARCVR